jgi:hypothetical protein
MIVMAGSSRLQVPGGDQSVAEVSVPPQTPGMLGTQGRRDSPHHEGPRGHFVWR